MRAFNSVVNMLRRNNHAAATNEFYAFATDATKFVNVAYGSACFQKLEKGIVGTGANTEECANSGGSHGTDEYFAM
jgi:hypothetical protein